MRAQLKLPVWLLATPLIWMALAAPRTCGGCLPFKLVSWEVGIDALELLLENPAGSLARPASLAELYLDDEIVGQAMIGPVGIGQQVVIIIDYKLPRRTRGDVDLRVMADGDLVGLVEVEAEELPGAEEPPAIVPPPRGP